MSRPHDSPRSSRSPCSGRPRVRRVPAHPVHLRLPLRLRAATPTVAAAASATPVTSPVPVAIKDGEPWIVYEQGGYTDSAGVEGKQASTGPARRPGAAPALHHPRRASGLVARRQADRHRG